MLVLTSVWFGAAHMQYTLASKAAVAANGLCWGYHYLATGRNILVPICAHVVANLIAALDEFRRSLM
jgi:membrane protease YdiL (CAAX protease family)